MSYLAILKRVIPFVITFAAGLMLASLFVSITPNFSLRSDSRWSGKCRDKHVRRENNELKERIRKLEAENEELRGSNWSVDPPAAIELRPFEFEGDHHPTPPPPPRKPNQPKVEIVR